MIRIEAVTIPLTFSPLPSQKPLEDITFIPCSSPRISTSTSGPRQTVYECRCLHGPTGSAIMFCLINVWGIALVIAVWKFKRPIRVQLVPSLLCLLPLETVHTSAELTQCIPPTRILFGTPWLYPVIHSLDSFISGNNIPAIWHSAEPRRYRLQISWQNVLHR